MLVESSRCEVAYAEVSRDLVLVYSHAACPVVAVPQ
jgi:hypothetical protein